MSDSSFDSMNELVMYIKYQFDRGKKTKEDYFDKNGSEMYYKTYNYDSTGMRLSSDKYDMTNATLSRTEYIYSGDVLAECVTYEKGDSVYRSVKFEFENKPENTDFLNYGSW